MNYNAEVVDWNNKIHKIEIELPRICPVCHQRTTPTYIYGHFNESECHIFSAMFYCTCGEIFFGKYVVNLYGPSQVCELMPNGFEARCFDDKIIKFSPEFVEIFNEASRAEALGLRNIAGMGYRRAIEYLIKAYCLLNNPEDADKINKERLAKLVDRIENPQLKTLAYACKELGNDETHTVSKYNEGLTEMKDYIDGLVSFVTIDLLAIHAKKTYK